MSYGPGSDQFIQAIARRTKINPLVVAAWVAQEGAYAPNGTGGSNFLNLRPYKGDPYSSVSPGGFERFSSVQDAIDATTRRLNQPFARPILAAAAAGKSPVEQIAAIAGTGWDESHYGGPGGPNLLARLGAVAPPAPAAGAPPASVGAAVRAPQPAPYNPPPTVPRTDTRAALVQLLDLLNTGATDYTPVLRTLQSARQTAETPPPIPPAPSQATAVTPAVAPQVYQPSTPPTYSPLPAGPADTVSVQPQPYTGQPFTPTDVGGVPSHGTAKPVRIIIHDAESTGSLTNLPDWWASQGQGLGSQYAIGDQGQVSRFAPDTAVTWHTGGNNTGSIGIELAGKASWTKQDWAAHPEEINALANTLAAVAARYGIPLVKSIESGVSTHAMNSAVYSASEGHSDPGPNFPFDEVLARARKLLGGGA